MSRPKFIRVTGWKRNPSKIGPKFLRIAGWRRNPVPITSREKWGARKTDLRERMPGAWKRGVTLVVHHTVTKRAANNSMDEAARVVRVVQGVHAGNAGGIGYGYLVAGGHLFEGRGFEVVAAAAYDDAKGRGWNRGPYAHVAVVGNYTSSGMSEADLRAIDDLTYHLKKRGAKVTAIIGHGDLMPTACPGKRGRKDLARYFGKRWKGKS